MTVGGSNGETDTAQTEKPQLTFGSLFAGIGGLDVGLHRAGMRCAWQVEIDPYCRQVLAEHFFEAQQFNDIRDVGAHNLTPVNVLAGGFPCQDISSAGRRKGIDGERSGLWGEYVRLIRTLRPNYVIVENVAALLHRERGFHRVLSDLAESGYDAQWDVLSAAAFGAPHIRERVFIVAYPSGVRGRNGDSPSLFQSVVPQEPGWGITNLPLASLTSNGRSYLDFPSDLRVGNGLSPRLDTPAARDMAAARVKGCGNAVVPGVAEHVARCVVDFDQRQWEAAA